VVVSVHLTVVFVFDVDVLVEALHAAAAAVATLLVAVVARVLNSKGLYLGDVDTLSRAHAPHIEIVLRFLELRDLMIMVSLDLEFRPNTPLALIAPHTFQRLQIIHVTGLLI